MKVKAKDVAAYGISGAAGGLLLQSFIGIAAGVTVYEIGRHLAKKISQNNLAHKEFVTDEFMKQFTKGFLADKESRHYTVKYAEQLDKDLPNNIFSNHQNKATQEMAYESLVHTGLNNVYKSAYQLKGKAFDWKIARGFAMGAAILLKKNEGDSVYVNLHALIAIKALQDVYNLSKSDAEQLVKYSYQHMDDYIKLPDSPKA